MENRKEKLIREHTRGREDEPKITARILGPTPAVKMWRRHPEQSHTRITTGNEKDNIKVCVYLFSPATVYFALSI